ncbi:ParB-like nuclease domain containing protein fused to HNH nuclease [Candidatus Nanohalococcus occultus]|uniref:ParB-like nuclease domain containing protein fused to HNH nuclease n=1 Tax=Candidatus Nanohalococcus occultus TaxID=2978047 RepID=A0ABY8CKZ2_9ARCH|nr:ParB-like nuclease domain containing protein fused to HNH nuclease [Candidatus Nanohaloarchaeota archaeon SVXNc]
MEELLVSILNDYFIGTLLLLRVDPEDAPFEPRTIEGVQETTKNPRRMILDGQQRITSLYYAFNSHRFPEEKGLGNTNYVYEFFIDMEHAVEEEWEDAVFSERRGTRSYKPYESEEKCFRKNVVPLKALRNYKNMINWSNKYKDLTGNDDLWDNFENYAENMMDFSVATVELPRVEDDEDLNTVVEIFERINKTGKPLAVFDLLTARLFREDIRLRDLWNGIYENREEFPRIHEFADGKDDNTYKKNILRTLALIRDQPPKRKNLIMLDTADFDEDWKESARSFEKALNRMKSNQDGGFGVKNSDWIPYNGLVAPTAAILRSIDNENDEAKQYERLQTWYWSTVFSQRYSSQTSTKSHKDVRDFEKWDDAKPEALMSDNQLKEMDLSSVSSKSSGVYKGVISLALLSGARDFLTGDSVDHHNLEDHHLFPKKYLKDQGVDSNKRNTVLNRSLIKKKTNQKIKAKAPSKYIEEMENSLGSEEEVKKVLEDHLIPEDAYYAMKNDDYDKFLKLRERRIMKEIRERVGATQQLESYTS